MGALVYLAVAILAVTLGLGTYWRDRQQLLRRHFAVLGLLTAVVYTAFFLYVALGEDVFRYIFTVTGSFLPAATLQVLDHFVSPRDPVNRRLVRRMWLATPLMVAVYLALELLLFRDHLGPSWPDMALGGIVYGTFVLVLQRMFTMLRVAPNPVERDRLRYLLFLAAGAVGSSALEGLARIYDGSLAPSVLGLLARQGSLPPVGALFVAVTLYALYQVIVLERLVDLHEIFSKGAAISISALALVTLSLAVMYMGQIDSWIHLAYDLFLACMLFLVAYEPYHPRLQASFARLMNRRGHQLQLGLNQLDQGLPRVVSKEHLARDLLGGLHSLARFSAISLYLRDADRQLVRLVDYRIIGDPLPMPVVTPSPFGDGFERGQESYLRQELERLQSWGPGDDELGARLRAMDAMRADVVLPLMAGSIVLGWLALEEDEASGGISQEEISRLMRTARRSAVILENLEDFEALQEQARLAALGTMAAGLAHEIRNPLAGIKGAAQYLQATNTQADDEDFLQVITDEVDRLNVVVSNFLDYSRPYELERQPDDINAIVTQVVSLLRAEGAPQGVKLVMDLAGGLPLCQVDGDKLVQVFLNLLKNAVQAVERKGGTVTVETRHGRLRRPGSEEGLEGVEISFLDDGPGIALEDLDKLFVPFFTTKVHGTGLGLAITQRIVKAHEGDLEVKSKPGRGSCFTVRVPVRPEIQQVTEDHPPMTLDR
jgi:nitrogen-specific signal transduction histidine kinase